MKTIKIFLASSEELTEDRNAFGNLVRRLDKIYEKRGIRIELFEWEDYDAAYNDRRKQDEYNDQIRGSDMFLALFHTKAGKFTIEEFNVATEEFKKHASPKVYTYCKDLQAGEQESPELAGFKRKLFEEMGHYWSRYNNRDSMQLHFVMQLQLVETSGMIEKLRLEDGTVILEGMPIAKIDNLQFAAGNEAYQKMSAELAALPEKIEKARQRVDKFPYDEDLIDDLQQKLNRYNKLKDEFSQIQKSLFETAQRIAAMQQEQVSDILRRAIEAFEDGNLERANTLLDEIAHEAEHHMAQLEQQRSLVHQDIEAFMLQAKTVMADTSIPINDRINKTVAIYTKAADWAEKSALHYEKYDTLLDDYLKFLIDYALYDKVEEINLHLLSMREELYGSNHPYTANSYNNLGLVYNLIDDFDKALCFFLKAKQIWVEQYGNYNRYVAFSYSNIGGVYNQLGEYKKALDSYSIGLDIFEAIFGKNHPYVATIYGKIGAVYYNLDDYTNAKKFFIKGLQIRENALGETHIDTASSYYQIGVLLNESNEYQDSLHFSFKALSIQVKQLGEYHPVTASTYNLIGLIYKNKGDYSRAMEYLMKALDIVHNVLGEGDLMAARLYNNIGTIYFKQEDTKKSLDYHFKAVDIFENKLGIEHLETANAYYNIGFDYGVCENYSMAKKYLLKALYIRERVLGPEAIGVADCNNALGLAYKSERRYVKAIESYLKAYTVFANILGSEHSETIKAKENIERTKKRLSFIQRLVLYLKTRKKDNVVGTQNPLFKLEGGTVNINN